MKLIITFELSKDFTEEKREAFKEAVQSAAMASIKRTYEYRGIEASEQVAESIKVEETN